MPLDRYLSERYLGIPTSAWLIALAVFAGTFAVLVIVRLVVIRRVGTWAKRTPTDLDDLVISLARLTRYFFLLVVSAGAATLFLELPPRPRAILRVVAVIALLFQVAIWGNGVITFLVNRYLRQRTDGAARTTLVAMGFLARLSLWAIILLVALKNFDIDITALVAGLGITGIAVALAVQNILGDLFGAVSIVLDKPFVVGDFITIDSFMGEVEHIGLKTTRLRSLSGEQIIIANTDLLRSRIRNYKRMFERRVVFGFAVEYATPPETLARIPGIVRGIVEAQELVRFDRSHFTGFGEWALTFETVYWVTVSDYNRYMDIQQTINLELVRRLAAEGIRFAFPTRKVLLERALPSELGPGEGASPYRD